MDLDAYFARIGWRGARTATSDVLAGLIAHHTRAIPFENLDVLLGRGVSLALPALEDKLVTQRRGGYCFEHSTLFAHVLRTLGFAVRTHSARVIMVTPKAQAPRTHMFLTVGDVMLDPGFGGFAARTPVPLDGTPAGEHRLVRDGDELVLEHAGQRLWITTLDEDLPIDFEVANHFTATSPASAFRQRMMLRMFTDDGKVTAMNRDVTITCGREETKLHLENRSALRELLVTYFGFDLPELSTALLPFW